MNRQGKTRLAKWYVDYDEEEKQKLQGEINRIIVYRDRKHTNFLEFRNYKIIYKRYAGLFFSICVDTTDNELTYLEMIHLFVEVLDQYFGNVRELDIVYNFHKAFGIMDEMIIGGEIMETSKTQILAALRNNQQREYGNDDKEADNDEEDEDQLKEVQLTVGLSVHSIARSHRHHQPFQLLYESQYLNWRCLLLCDGKTLIQWDPATKKEVNRINWQSLAGSKESVSATYIPKAKVIRQEDVFLILCEDGCVYGLDNSSKTLEQLNSVQLDSQFSLAINYLHQSQLLLVVGINCISIMRVTVSRRKEGRIFDNTTNNSHNSKNLTNTSPILFELSPVKSIECVLDWHKGLFLHQTQSISSQSSSAFMFCWDSKDLAVYTIANAYNTTPTNSMSLHTILHNLGSNHKSIIQVIFAQLYSYILSGHSDGEIKVSPISSSTSKNTTNSTVFSFQLHIRPVVFLAMHIDPTLFWSCCEEVKIALWSLDSFSLICVFDIESHLTGVHLLNNNALLGQRSDEICQGSVMTNDELITVIDSKVASINKGCQEWQITNTNNFDSMKICLSLRNNSGLVFPANSLRHLSSQSASSLLSTSMITFFPPPNYYHLLSIVPHPYFDSFFFALVDAGDICMYKSDNSNSALAKNIYQTDSIKDSAGYSLAQKAAIIRFLNVSPPKLDLEINELLKQTNSKSNLHHHHLQSPNISTSPPALLAVGLSKGTIVFLDISNESTLSIHCRFSYHRERITEIIAVSDTSSSSGLLLSVCAELKLNVTKLQADSITCVYSCYLTGEVSLYAPLSGSEGLIFACNKDSGEMNVLCVTDKGIPMGGRNAVQNCHEGQIKAVDFLEKQKQRNLVVLTIGSDRKMKIWEYSNKTNDLFLKLLVLINVENDIHAGCFCSFTGDVLVAHGNKLSLVRLTLEKIEKTQELELDSSSRKIQGKIQFDMPIDEVLNISLQPSSSSSSKHTPKGLRNKSQFGMVQRENSQNGLKSGEKGMKAQKKQSQSPLKRDQQQEISPRRRVFKKDGSNHDINSNINGRIAVIDNSSKYFVARKRSVSAYAGSSVVFNQSQVGNDAQQGQQLPQEQRLRFKYPQRMMERQVQRQQQQYNHNTSTQMLQNDSAILSSNLGLSSPFNKKAQNPSTAATAGNDYRNDKRTNQLEKQRSISHKPNIPNNNFDQPIQKPLGSNKNSLPGFLSNPKSRVFTGTITNIPHNPSWQDTMYIYDQQQQHPQTTIIQSSKKKYNITPSYALDPTNNFSGSSMQNYQQMLRACKRDSWSSSVKPLKAIISDRLAEDILSLPQVGSRQVPAAGQEWETTSKQHAQVLPQLRKQGQGEQQFGI